MLTKQEFKEELLVKYEKSKADCDDLDIIDAFQVLLCKFMSTEEYIDFLILESGVNTGDIVHERDDGYRDFPPVLTLVVNNS